MPVPNGKVHLWVPGWRHAACGQQDSDVLRCSRDPEKTTCKRCERWYMATGWLFVGLPPVGLS